MITKPMRVIESPGSPSENELWLDGTTLKRFQNGEWVAISGGGEDQPGGDTLSPMIVDGVMNWDNSNKVYVFTPGSGSSTIVEAYEHMRSGGTVYLKCDSNIEEVSYLAISCYYGSGEYWITGYNPMGNSNIQWIEAVN